MKKWQLDILTLVLVVGILFHFRTPIQDFIAKDYPANHANPCRP
jgi:hypothetical protein